MRVRQPVAKFRHIGGSAAVADFLILSHSSAQARIRSLDARGSDGGGTETSTGGSGGKPVFDAGALGRGAGASFCGAGAGGFCAPGILGAGLPCAEDLAGFALGAAGLATLCAWQE